MQFLSGRTQDEGCSANQGSGSAAPFKYLLCVGKDRWSSPLKSATEKCCEIPKGEVQQKRAWHFAYSLDQL